jgi:hypothetical protein
MGFAIGWWLIFVAVRINGLIGLSCRDHLASLSPSTSRGNITLAELYRAFSGQLTESTTTSAASQALARTISSSQVPPAFR